MNLKRLVVGLGGVAALGMIGKMAIDRSMERDVEKERDLVQALTTTTNDLTAAEALLRPVTPEQERLRAVQGVWQTFDRLRGPEFRTLAMLNAHLLQANQTVQHVPEPEASQLLAYNQKEFRKRISEVMVVGEMGRTDGANAEIFVPSLDPQRCPVLAESWKKDGTFQQLRDVGFATVRCDNGSAWPLVRR
ncbi:MAG TPA: hypothetical protein VHC69_31655 [Polyangiaceae bacterium]|nr:hypothetical protein [Polyangiaceae bacterium]